MTEQRIPAGEDIFEVHTWRDARLPFIYHPDHFLRRLYGNSNWHDSLEILYVTSGEGEALCDCEKLPMRAGDIIVINSGAVHRMTSDSGVSYHCFIVCSQFCLDNGFDVTRTHFATHIRDDALVARIQRAIAEFTADDDAPYHVTGTRAAVLDMLTHLTREYAIPLDERIKMPGETIRAALDYLNRHFTEPITIDALCAEIGVSKFHFLRNFKRNTGYTVISYLHYLRCRRAARLLVGTDVRIGEIAVACGFENLSYFSKIFEKYMGTQPSRFRASRLRKRDEPEAMR